MQQLLTAFITAFCLGSPSYGGSQGELTPIDRINKTTLYSLRPALDASFHFRVDGGADCTGTYISNAGHFITALHCIAGCLIKRQATRRELAIEKPTAKIRSRVLHTYKYLVDDELLVDGVSCSGLIGNEQKEMRVMVAGGPGWLSPKESLAGFSRRFPAQYKALLDEGFEHAGDFAIVQALDTKPRGCLTLANEAPTKDAQLHAISYPCLKRDGLETNGKTPLFTFGRRTNGFKESDYFKSLGPRRIDFDVTTVDRPETFFSTLDIEKCGSGTSLLDNGLNIVGIATRVYKSGTDYESGSLESINSAHIIRELKRRRPDDFEALSACSKTRNQTLRLPGRHQDK